MTIFSKNLLKYFDAIHGAYSPVTFREATGDRSITLDSDEKSVIYSIYPESSFDRKGGASITGLPSEKDFYIHYPNQSTSQKQLKIYYPKKQGRELRLYFKNGLFEANKDDIIYLFVKKGEQIPHIGVMDRTNWNNLLKSFDMKIIYERQLSMDDEDEDYQNLIGAESVKLATTGVTLKYIRNPKTALEALKLADFTCEANPDHTTFQSVSGNNYMECHHFIPISLQESFDVSLDIHENLCSLCPTCHRYIHYGVAKDKEDLLLKLWNNKKEGLRRKGIDISFDELLNIYIPQSNKL